MVIKSIIHKTRHFTSTVCAMTLSVSLVIKNPSRASFCHCGTQSAGLLYLLESARISADSVSTEVLFIHFSSALCGGSVKLCGGIFLTWFDSTVIKCFTSWDWVSRAYSDPIHS